MAHTSVLYVHGMGDQRRYEESGRLVEMLERHVRHGGDAAGSFSDVTTGLEPSRADGRSVAYISVTHVPAGAAAVAGKAYRFYEAYWAPVATGATSWRSVVWWLVRQIASPIKGLRSGWRSRGRVRRALLHEHWATISRATPAPAPSDREHLLRLFDDFDTPHARAAFPRDSQESFHEFVVAGIPGDRGARLGALADAWHGSYRVFEWKNLFLVTTLLLAMGLGAAALSGAALWILRVVQAGATGQTGALMDAIRLGADWRWGSWIVIGVLGASGMLRFLSEYVGDVQLWATYEETGVKYAKRREILDATVRAATHVLSDPACERLVVVAHSLGTSIALDMLLDLGRHNRAVDAADPMGEHGRNGTLPLHKIDHLITVASPIDKVHYFFEDYQGRQYRYNQTVESVRGDVGTPPFGASAAPRARPGQRICWVNVWDQADIIGGSIETPSHPSRADVGIINIEVASLPFPEPGAAHLAYFEHAGVARLLHAVIFDRAGSRSGQTSPLPAGIGERMSSTRVWQGIALGVPWLVVIAALISMFTESRPLHHAAQLVAALPIGALILGAIVGGQRKHRRPLGV